MGDVTSPYASSDKGKKYFDNLIARAAETADGKQVLRRASEQTPAEAADVTRERLLRVRVSWDTTDLAREVYLLANPWGFRLEDFHYPGVQIWHGTEDVKVSPIQVVRCMAKRLPQCDLYEVEGKNHFTIIEWWEDIVTKSMIQS